MERDGLPLVDPHPDTLPPFHSTPLVSLALLFPGQGSQFVGMGREFAEAFPVARETFDEADELIGSKLSDLCWSGPEADLTQTRNAQPAILTHSVAALRVARDLLGDVSVAAGHSLGEFSAHVAAGTLSFADALVAVRLRGELMFEAGEQRKGTMAAILGLGDAELEAACERASEGGKTCVPANLNSVGQVVISGDIDGVRAGMQFATEAGARRVVELNVSGAFHSPLMAPAEEGLRARLETLEFADPDFPVIANVTAGAVTSGANARELLVEQLTSPVRWAPSVASMVAMGVERFVELGPGSVLCGLNRRNARGIPCVSVGHPEDLEKLESA